MTVGLAFAGGSSVAMLATQCTLHWLDREKFLTADADINIGTCSGGTVGTGVYMSARDRLAFPDYDVAATYKDVAGLNFVNRGETWFARATSTSALWSIHYGDLIKKTLTGKITWAHILKDIVFAAYNIKEIVPGPYKWVTNVLYSKKEDSPPLKNKYGYVPDVLSSGMGQLWSEFNRPGVGEPHHIVKDFDKWTTMSYSTHIASYLIYSYNNKTAFFDSEKYLPSNAEYFFSDGGWIDETAITTLLVQKVTSLVSYVSWPGTFVIDGRVSNFFGYTKHGNHTLGPKYSQVFEVAENILDEALKNLTDPKIMRATFTNVKVVQNDFFGIKPYTLKKFMILVDQRSQDFIDSFKDKRISRELSADPRFPNLYENWDKLRVEWTPLTANSYCNLQQFKGDMYKEELRALFDGAKAAKEEDLQCFGCKKEELRAPQKIAVE